MNLSDLSIRRPVFATVASLLIIVLGVILAWRFEGGAWRRIQLIEPGAAEEEILEREAAKVAPSMPGIPAPQGEGSVRDFAESEGDAVEAEQAEGRRGRLPTR